MLISISQKLPLWVRFPLCLACESTRPASCDREWPYQNGKLPMPWLSVGRQKYHGIQEPECIFGIASHNEKIAFGEFCCLWLESILVCECEWEEYTRRSKTSRQSSQLAVDQHYTGPPPPFTRWKQETRDLERIGWKTNISGVDHEQQVTWARNWTGVALFWQLVFGCCRFLSSEDFSSKSFLHPRWGPEQHPPRCIL